MRGLASICALALVAVAAPARAGNPKKDVEKVVKAQVKALFGEDEQPAPYASNPQFVTSLPEAGLLDAAGLRKAIGSYVVNWPWVNSAKVANVKVGISPAGSEAWVSFTVKVAMAKAEDAPPTFDLRVTEALVLDEKWMVVGGHWSKPAADKAANAAAKKGELATPVALVDKEETGGQAESFGGHLRDGDIANSVSDSPDVGVFSTDAKKPRMGGKKNRTAWKSWWKSVKVDGNVAEGADGSGEIMWIAANLSIEKKGYSIPARVFLVIANEDGVERVVAGHISIPEKGGLVW